MNKPLTPSEIETIEFVSTAVIRAENKLKEYRKKVSITLAGAVFLIGSGYFAPDLLLGSPNANATADARPAIAAARARIEQVRSNLAATMAGFQREQNAFHLKLATDPGAVLFAADFAPIRAQHGCF
jgi:hypothetical protein